jgi:arylsulfatase A-like enzyme
MKAPRRSTFSPKAARAEAIIRCTTKSTLPELSNCCRSPTEPGDLPNDQRRFSKLIAKIRIPYNGKKAGLSIAAILILIAGAISFAAAPPAPQDPNVILIVADQLRADRIHAYGNPRLTTPNIDRLAERGTRFARYFTVGSWTAPSFSALHTSLFPSRSGVTLFWHPGMPVLNKDVPVMAEVFKYHGYYTTALVNNSLAGQALTGRGFDEYYEGAAIAIDVTERVGLGANSQHTAPATLDRVIPWLDRHRAQRFFLYVHFWEPHSPYNPPPEDDIFKSDAYPYLSDTGYDVATGPLKRLAMLEDQKAIERLYQLYDGKIHFVDRYIGKLLDHVRELGLEGNTVIALTSDHGELLYTHPKDFLTFDHRSLYDENLHIPFIVAGPGVPHGQVLNGLGSNIDSAPTLLDLAGLPPLDDAEGHSLVPMIQGKTSEINPYIYAEEDIGVPARSVRSQNYRLIKYLWDGKTQLFDLVHDPGEQTDVVNANPAALKELSARLNEWMKVNQPPREIQLRRWRIFTAPEKETTIDDQTTGTRFLLTGGGWHNDVATESGNWAVGAFWTEGGDGSRTAVWRSDDPLIGNYRISVYYGHPNIGHLASNASFTMVFEGGSKTVEVDFNRGAGQWNLLGTAVNPYYVRLTNAANGAVLADAVRFERVE